MHDLWKLDLFQWNEQMVLLLIELRIICNTEYYFTVCMRCLRPCGHVTAVGQRTAVKVVTLLHCVGPGDWFTWDSSLQGWQRVPAPRRPSRHFRFSFVWLKWEARGTSKWFLTFKNLSFSAERDLKERRGGGETWARMLKQKNERNMKERIRFFSLNLF